MPDFLPKILQRHRMSGYDYTERSATVGNYFVRTTLHEGRYEAVSIRCKDVDNNSMCSRTRDKSIGAHTPFVSRDTNDSSKRKPGEKVCIVLPRGPVNWCSSVVLGLSFDEVCSMVAQGE